MKHINIFFKNSIQIEGTLISIEDNQMIIKSLDKIHTIIVPDIKDNILFYKISSSNEEYNLLADKPNKSIDDLKQIAKFKSDLNHIERSAIREKLLFPSLIKENPNVNYDQQIASITKYPKKEITRTNSGFSSELQRMFSKKY